jgi:hypothetical protein
MVIYADSIDTHCRACIDWLYQPAADRQLNLLISKRTALPGHTGLSGQWSLRRMMLHTFFVDADSFPD